MARYAYVNGRYVPHGEAAVHIEDRGYQFADGVYEVVPIQNGRMIDEDPHLDRLDYSLRELRIAWPVSRAALKLILREMLRRNGLTDGLLYLQVTRGVAPRDHKFPKAAKPARRSGSSLAGSASRNGCGESMMEKSPVALPGS